MAWQGRLIDASAAGTNDKASCSAPILITYPSPTVDRSAVRYWAPDLQVPLPDRHHTAVRGCRRVTRDLDETVADVGQDRRRSRGDVQELCPACQTYVECCLDDEFLPGLQGDRQARICTHYFRRTHQQEILLVAARIIQTGNIAVLKGT